MPAHGSRTPYFYFVFLAFYLFLAFVERHFPVADVPVAITAERAPDPTSLSPPPVGGASTKEPAAQVEVVPITEASTGFVPRAPASEARSEQSFVIEQITSKK